MIDIVCLGSINIDEFYAVDHIARPGETVTSSYERLPGGKGSNQAVALSLAGVSVCHVGGIGEDGQWIKQLESGFGVNCDWIVTTRVPTGRAIIQVAKDGENAIVLYAGSNYAIPPDHILDAVTQSHGLGARWMVLQGELRPQETHLAIKEGKKLDMIVCLNPAPCSPALLQSLDLSLVDVLVVNQVEGTDLMQYLGTKDTNQDPLVAITTALSSLSLVILTLGPNGVRVASRLGNEWIYTHHALERKVNVVDTTGAGDTFLGYFLATLIQLETTRADLSDFQRLERAVKRANIAAGMCCESKGAMNSIPKLAF